MGSYGAKYNRHKTIKISKRRQAELDAIRCGIEWCPKMGGTGALCWTCREKARAQAERAANEKADRDRMEGNP